MVIEMLVLAQWAFGVASTLVHIYSVGLCNCLVADKDLHKKGASQFLCIMRPLPGSPNMMYRVSIGPIKNYTSTLLLPAM